MKTCFATVHAMFIESYVLYVTRSFGTHSNNSKPFFPTTFYETFNQGCTPYTTQHRHTALLDSMPKFHQWYTPTICLMTIHHSVTSVQSVELSKNSNTVNKSCCSDNRALPSSNQTFYVMLLSFQQDKNLPCPKR